MYTCYDVIIKLSNDRLKTSPVRQCLWSCLNIELLVISCPGFSYSGLY